MVRAIMTSTSRCASFLLAGMLLTVAATADKLVVSNFATGNLDAWKTKEFAGETRYTLTRIAGQAALRANSDHSASGLYRRIRVDLEKYPYLNWSWRVEQPLQIDNEKLKAGDDYAARIYVIVDGGLLFWRTRALNYVWASGADKYQAWPNAFAGRNAQMLALRNKLDGAGIWYAEKRNIYQDLQQRFGRKFRYIDAIALMTDTDNSGGRAIAYYGDIYFSSD